MSAIEREYGCCIEIACVGVNATFLIRSFKERLGVGMHGVSLLLGSKEANRRPSCRILPWAIDGAT